MKSPLFQSLSNSSPPIYNLPAKDKWTRLHYAVPFVVYMPVITFFAWRAIVLKEVSWYHFVWLLSLMTVFWSWLEYVLHKYVLHRNKYGIMNLEMANLIHDAHHDYPNDDYRLVVHLWASVPGAFFFYGVCWLIFGNHLADAAFACIVTYYLVYEFAHISAHKINSKNPLLQKIKKHHLKHHFQDKNRGFGFTSPAWDKLWDTDFEKKPAHLAKQEIDSHKM
jgi:sterol desaturase/sphingolipid hydroxylase (fatty acid hydroxylase superfamily)